MATVKPVKEEKFIKKTIIAIMCLASLMLGACAVNPVKTLRTNKTWTMDAPSILSEAGEGYSLKLKSVKAGQETVSVEGGKKNKEKLAYYDLTWSFVNEGDSPYNVDIEHIRFNDEIPMSVECETSMRISTNTEKEWTLHIADSHDKDDKDVAFDAVFESNGAVRAFTIKTDLSQLKKTGHCDIEYEEIMGEPDDDGQDIHEHDEDNDEEHIHEENKDDSNDKDDVDSDDGADEPGDTNDYTSVVTHGSDDFGYIYLPGLWQNFKTAGLTEEENAKMMQWQSFETGAIVTLQAEEGTTAVDKMERVTSSAAEMDGSTCDVEYLHAPSSDYDALVCMPEVSGQNVVIFVFDTDYSDKTYLLGLEEDSSVRSIGEFYFYALQIVSTHTELAKTGFEQYVMKQLEELSNTPTEVLYGDSDEGEAPESQAIDASIYTPGTTFTIRDYVNNTPIQDVYIPEGLVVNEEYTTSSTLVLDKPGTYSNLWITAGPNSMVNEYLKTGSVNTSSGIMNLLSYELCYNKKVSNGAECYVLKLSYLMDVGKPDVYNIYHVSVQQDENTGVSLLVPEDTMVECGFASIETLVDTLFQ